MSAVDPKRRRFLVHATATAGGLAAAAATNPLLATLAPSARARAQGAPVEADVSTLKPGELTTIEWRSKPVWVLRRTPDMLARLENVRGELADPDCSVASQQPAYARNPDRSVEPELFVAVGLCTHLGCVPGFQPQPGSLQPDWPGGFYCPCHGSKFDLAGRVFKGSPAPTNLLVPRYSVLGPERIVIGRDSAGDAT
jgi:ubiquinol-cytochrome c reductase iron-sulfur subunit